jgi:hypothetical protein
MSRAESNIRANTNQVSELAHWQNINIKHFAQYLYPGRDSGTVGAIKLFDEENNVVAWVWLHDRESVPETYVFPYNGRVEMHFSVSVRSVLIDMLTSKMTDLHFSIERQDAYLTVQELPAMSDRRKRPSDVPDGDRRKIDQRQNVVQISQDRRIVDRRRSS